MSNLICWKIEVSLTSGTLLAVEIWKLAPKVVSDKKSPIYCRNKDRTPKPVNVHNLHRCLNITVKFGRVLLSSFRDPDLHIHTHTHTVYISRKKPLISCQCIILHAIAGATRFYQRHSKVTSQSDRVIQCKERPPLWDVSYDSVTAQVFFLSVATLKRTQMTQIFPPSDNFGFYGNQNKNMWPWFLNLVDTPPLTDKHGILQTVHVINCPVQFSLL